MEIAGSRCKWGTAYSIRSGTRCDYEPFLRRFPNHRGTFRRTSMSDISRYFLLSKYAKCGKMSLQNRIRHGGRRNECV